MSKELLEQLKVSILSDDLSTNRKKWAKSIAKQDIDLMDWVHVLEDEDKKLATRFLWFLGSLVEVKPEMLYPILEHCFERRYTSTLPGYKRSLTKWLWLAGVPPAIEGLVLDEVIKWIMDYKIKVAVKCYGLEILLEFAKQYPEIIPEIRLIMEEQLPLNTVAFSARCKKIRKQLNKLAPED